MTEGREYDIIIIGATGFTGKLVVEFLAEKYGNGEIHWAIAGRNKSKLDKLVDTIAETAAIYGNHDLVKQLDTIVLDTSDRKNVLDVCASTKVILTLVGPYMLYGDILVECCVETDTDYCDLTGEPTWVRQNVNKYHKVAKKKGTRIVHCCGFDSIPSDLGTLCCSTAAKEKYPNSHKSDLVKVTHVVQRMKGGASGGTIASIIAMAQAPMAVKREIMKCSRDPYYLCPDLGEEQKAPSGDVNGPKHDKVTNMWYAPFLMAGVNSRIVFRSYALNKAQYGSNMQYSEVVKSGNFFKALIGSMIPVLFVLFAFPPTRWLLQQFLPKPGFGPSRHAMFNGTLESSIVAETKSGKYVVCQVKCDRDPGYSGTARMICETAIAMVQTFDEKTKGTGGILTTASAPGLGMDLVKRLNNVGLTFTTSVMKESSVEKEMRVFK